MYTLTAKFIFRDGAAASASVTTASPQRDAAVIYSGEFSRLPNRFARMQNCDLRVWAENRAEMIGAALEFTEEGQFDWWAL